MSSRELYVEFSLGDGDERPHVWTEISQESLPSGGESCLHTISFYFNYSPFPGVGHGEFTARLLWDGITDSRRHMPSGIQGFGVDTESGQIIGSPTPVIHFSLCNAIDIEEFVRSWEVTCSPCTDCFYEDWRGCKRILSEDELERRGLTGDHPNQLSMMPISKGMRSIEECFVLEKQCRCEIECVTSDPADDYSPLAESSESTFRLPAGWLQDPSYEDVLANYQDFHEKLVDKLITDHSITRQDLIDLSSYETDEIAILALFHPLADKAVNDRYLSVHYDGDGDLDSIFQHIDFNRSLPISPWRYCLWLIEADEGYAEDLLDACDWKLEPELCKLFIEHGEKIDHDYYEREVIYNVLSKVVNLPEELKGRHESLANQ